MEDGLFPSYMTIVADDASEIEEERRLAYVGITRAMEDLTITCARSRMIRGETQYNPVSRFVREIPEKLLDNAPPAAKRRSFESFDDFERELGRGAGFGSLQNRNSGNSFGSSAGYGGGAGYGSGSVGYGGGTDYRSGAQAGAYDFRPKATLKPKVTAKADKPFIAKEMSSLNNLAGLQKGMVHQAPADLEYGVGDRVRHIKYGEGTVLAIDREPRDYKVTISFDKAGQKIMYASFAKLKRV
jgi:DNA helicase-2/ATP-dependent DNA helicase PcrA